MANWLPTLHVSIRKWTNSCCFRSITVTFKIDFKIVERINFKYERGYIMNYLRLRGLTTNGKIDQGELF